MKNDSRYGKKFDALVKKLSEKTPPELVELDPVVQVVIGFLEWNATATSAARAHEQMMAVLVDNNDLRVSLPQELLPLIGAKYPQGAERLSRLREVLHEIYAREHAVSLDSLVGKPKKQIRAYVDSLPGITQYVAAQLALLGFGVHAMPVDDSIAHWLRAEEVVDQDASIQNIAQFIERHVKAPDAAQVHRQLRVWADGKSQRSAAGRSTGTRRKTAKKAVATKKKSTGRAKTSRKK